jgi:hypothetical protein
VRAHVNVNEGNAGQSVHGEDVLILYTHVERDLFRTQLLNKATALSYHKFLT